MQRDLLLASRFGKDCRNLEPRLHAVQPRRSTAEQFAASADEEHRHGYGTRTLCFNVAGSAQQLRDRHPQADVHRRR